MNTHSIKLIISSLAQDRQAWIFCCHKTVYNFDISENHNLPGKKQPIKIGIVIVTYTWFLQPENKVLRLAADLSLFNVMFSRWLCVKSYLNSQLKSSMQVARKWNYHRHYQNITWHNCQWALLWSTLFFYLVKAWKMVRIWWTWLHFE